jgi:hypothetical protein
MHGNRVGNIALLTSIVGLVFLQVFLAQPLLRFLPYASLLCPLGSTLGLLGLMRRPRRTAGWATVLGILGSLYVPTLWS